MTKGYIPYGRHVIDEDDIAAVAAVLSGDWLTTGPTVGAFEAAFAEYVGATHAVAAANGTAALHLCMLAAGIGPGDEVIVPALTFAASANCARYVGATIVFCDVRPDSLTIDPVHLRKLITPRTKAIVAVDYAGLPCDLDELLEIATAHKLLLVEDACHAVGAVYRGRRVGSIAHLSAFSLHPVKHMTSGEGGVVTTNNEAFAARVRLMRNHGITTDHRERERLATWSYDMVELGYNYRLTDLQCALGLSQLKKMSASLVRRRQIAARYRSELSRMPALTLPDVPTDREHAWHLYPVRLQGANCEERRRRLFEALRVAGIGVNVHYLPVYLHTYYKSLGYPSGLCPVAERAYQGLLSLPMWAGLSDDDQARVICSLSTALDRVDAT